MNRLDLPAHDVIMKDDVLGYGIYRLRDPLEPGEVIEFGFDLTVRSRGFVNHGTDIAVVDNGTYFTKRDCFPVIGYDAQRQLADPEERRRSCARIWTQSSRARGTSSRPWRASGS